MSGVAALLLHGSVGLAIALWLLLVGPALAATVGLATGLQRWILKRFHPQQYSATLLRWSLGLTILADFAVGIYLERRYRTDAVWHMAQYGLYLPTAPVFLRDAGTLLVFARALAWYWLLSRTPLQRESFRVRATAVARLTAANLGADLLLAYGMLRIAAQWRDINYP